MPDIAAFILQRLLITCSEVENSSTNGLFFSVFTQPRPFSAVSDESDIGLIKPIEIIAILSHFELMTIGVAVTIGSYETKLITIKMYKHTI